MPPRLHSSGPGGPAPPHGVAGPRISNESRTGSAAAWPEKPHVVVLDPFNAGLAFARRITRLGGQVTFIIDPSEPTVARSRGTTSILVPFAPAGERWLTVLRELAAAGERVLVVPATDRGSELLVRANSQLPENLVRFETAEGAHISLMDKDSADEVARRAGVPVPWTVIVRSLEELAEVESEAPWPCVVKPAISHEWRALYGSERVFLVRDAGEARARLAGPLGRGLRMLLSQYVPGTDADVEEAIVVRLADGSYPVCFGCRKLRQWPPGFGSTALGEAAPLEETTAIAKRVLDEAGFVGVAGVEVKRDAETDRRWFLEVNVRMPAQWGLGDVSGGEASERLVAAMLGTPLGPPPRSVAGVRIALLDLDVQAIRPILRAAPWFRRPFLALRLIRPYLGAKELGLFDLRDPGPGLAFLWTWVRRHLLRVRSSGKEVA